MRAATETVLPAVGFHHVTLGYDQHPAVHHLDGSIAKGELLAIAGPNGSGKSTLLRGITGLMRPFEGQIDLNGLQARDIAYLPQLADIDRTFPISVQEFAGMGLWRKTGPWRALLGDHKAQLRDALAAVGLAGFEARPIGTLSGGQLQRALFARVLVQDSPLILLDEPLSAIDAKTSADLLALIERWHTEGRTVVAVLHDFELIKKNFPKTLLLAREAIAWGPTIEALSDQNLSRARAMSESWDDSAPWCQDPLGHKHSPVAADQSHATAHTHADHKHDGHRH
jgi:zinc/manganese transport system ATP-binding protein